MNFLGSIPAAQPPRVPSTSLFAFSKILSHSCPSMVGARNINTLNRYLYESRLDALANVTSSQWPPIDYREEVVS